MPVKTVADPTVTFCAGEFKSTQGIVVGMECCQEAPTPGALRLIGLIVWQDDHSKSRQSSQCFIQLFLIDEGLKHLALE